LILNPNVLIPTYTEGYKSPPYPSYKIVALKLEVGEEAAQSGERVQTRLLCPAYNQHRLVHNIVAVAVAVEQPMP
jgi:hypothetical protein